MADITLLVKGLVNRQDIETLLAVLDSLGLDDPTQPIAVNGLQNSLLATAPLEHITFPDDPESE